MGPAALLAIGLMYLLGVGLAYLVIFKPRRRR